MLIRLTALTNQAQNGIIHENANVPQLPQLRETDRSAPEGVCREA